MTDHRLACWNKYKEELSPLMTEGHIELPVIPEECVHNGHMFYIKTKDLNERTELIAHLKKEDISTTFHYIPLHSAPAGVKYGRFNGQDEYTTAESERLLRLPMHCELSPEQVSRVTDAIKKFYNK